MTYTLAADGTSDAVLLPILTWSLKQHGTISVTPQWVDFGRIPHSPTFEARLRTAFELYPCDVLFIHRDAEGYPVHLRREEIASAVEGISIQHVPVVPVRMTEAWLLANEGAIRSAAGNPNGTQDLKLPEVKRLEDVPDPKRVLHEVLILASGLNMSRRSKFRPRERVHLIPNYIDDFGHLNALSAFRTLQEDIRVLSGKLRTGH